jgi:alkaline phosphatase
MNSGLFSPSHMEYFMESANAKNPTLEEMTRAAIGVLAKEPNGFVLLVEGESILVLLLFCKSR